MRVNNGILISAAGIITNGGLVLIDNVGDQGIESLGTLTNNNEVKIGSVGGVTNIGKTWN